MEYEEIDWNSSVSGGRIRKRVKMNKINILASLLIMVLFISGCSGTGKEGQDSARNPSIEKMDAYSEESEGNEEQENPDYEIKTISMKHMRRR